MDIEWTITPESIEWEMNWEINSKITGKGGTEMIFEEGPALAHLLLNEVVYLNSHWWKHFKLGDRKPDGHGYQSVKRDDAEWSEEDSKIISVNVGCNDVFAWACSDSEPLPYKQIETLYRMWIKDPSWGPAVWCMIQRNQMPQKPVEDIIRREGIWSFDELKLGPNYQEAEAKAYLARVIASGALKASAQP
jgi:hypothetical protein